MNVQSRLGRAESHLDNEPARAGGETSTARLTLVEIWHVARLRLRIILGAAAAIFAIAAMIDLSLTPLYTGTAIVMIDQRENKVINVEQVLSGIPTDQASIFNQIQIIQSRELAWRVITKLGLDHDPEFNLSLDRSWTRYLWMLNPLTWLPGGGTGTLQSKQEREQKIRDATINRFEHMLTVSQIELSTALKVQFESQSPDKAATITNAIAEAYVEDQLNAKFEATLKATQWLAGRLGQLADQARMADVAVEKYKEDHHLTEVAAAGGNGLVSVLDQQIAAVNAQLVQAHTDVAQAQANLARVRALVSSGHAADASQVVGSTLIGQLIQQQAELIQKQAEMSTRYGPEHPKMLDLLAEKRDLDAKIREEISHVVGTAENEFAVAQAREAALQANLNSLEAGSTVQGQARVKLRELEANALSSRDLYNNFVSRSKETQQQEGLQIPDARIISRSPIPNEASFPNNELVFALSLVAALFAGFVVAFVLERLDNGFRTAGRVEALLEMPVLASLPDVNLSRGVRGFYAPDDAQSGPAGNVADLVVDRPLSSYSEAIRGLQLGISLTNVDSVPKVILVTSALPAEAKTTTALSLARHIAQTGQRVVLVDADLRRPMIKSMIEIDENAHDLIDVLRGEKAIEEAQIKDPKSSAIILPVLKHVKNAPDLIESQAMSNVVDNLRKSFDVVILDSAPVLPVSDSKLLARMADAVLFVVRWERTPRTAATDAVKALREIHAPLAGAALTRADTRRLQYYSFGYGHYGYSYAKYYEA